MAQNDDTTTEQIDKELVARVPGQVGDQRNPFGDGPEMRYFNIAAWHRYNDVHRGLFIDSEDTDGVLRYGWRNDERSTWKITDIGSEIVVEDTDLELPEDEDVEDEGRYVKEWIEILIKELRWDVENRSTRRSVEDEIEFVGSKTLRISDMDGRTATVTISLE